MAEPEHPNFDLVGCLFGENDEIDMLENVMQNALKDIESAKNEATKRKTKYWVDKVNDEFKNLGVGKNITDMDAKTLNAVLTSYDLSSYIHPILLRFNNKTLCVIRHCGVTLSMHTS